MILHQLYFFFFFFNDTATTEIYTLSLHDALPIYMSWDVCDRTRKFDSSSLISSFGILCAFSVIVRRILTSRSGPSKPYSWRRWRADRKSTRLNSSHLVISYAVFCLKKKKILYGMR